MKNYDKKVKQTRILYSDWVWLKGVAETAGVSMSQALHTIITRDWAMANKAKPVSAIATEPVPTAFALTPAPEHPSYRAIPIPAIATNGSGIPAFRIKMKGVKHV